ncbi:hypothetical protein AB6A40_007604 [Gnathostoma spinigerum]|uniref:protein-tyrosine-phosphatase n=1 Tax=Gnathostoma spinigerum TaxID=75299 RepID=A0ABD6EXA4_9BILA
MPVPDQAKLPHVDYKFLFMLDMLNQNIFADNLLCKALEYISDGIEEGGNVLVHCEAGMSRSVTVVIAFLMRHFQWNVEKAYTHLRNIRPSIAPNDSFMRQLAIFYNLEYDSDIGTVSHNADYQRFCILYGIPFKTDRDEVYLSRRRSDLKPAKNVAFDEFRCRKCRQMLFTDEGVLRHETLFPTTDRYIIGKIHRGQLRDKLCPFGYLLCPMDWMNMNSQQGKIYCPKCHEKLGSYDWAGRECLGNSGLRCGATVKPWIHLQVEKLDRIPRPSTKSVLNINVRNSRGPSKNESEGQPNIPESKQEAASSPSDHEEKSECAAYMPSSMSDGSTRVEQDEKSVLVPRVVISS